MAKITSIGDKIILACSNRVFIFENDQVTQTFALDEAGAVPNLSSRKCQVLCLYCEYDHCCVATNRRQILIFQLNSLSAAPFRVLNVDKPSSCLRLVIRDEVMSLLVADRSGLVTKYELAEDNAFNGGTEPNKHKPLLGHLSMILDMAIHADRLLTCDRDDKIRISHYPNAYNIEAYLLGHTDFVRSLTLCSHLNQQYVASVAGDSTIKLWHLASAQLITSLAIAKSATSLPIKLLTTTLALPHSTTTYILCVLTDCIQLFELYDTPLPNLVHRYTTETLIDCSIWDACLIANGAVVTVTNDGDPLVRWKIEENRICLSETFKGMSKEVTACLSAAVDEMPSLIKNIHFDNQRKYEEEKEKRIKKKRKMTSDDVDDDTP